MKKLLLLGIFGFILGLGFTVMPAMAGAQVDAQATLAMAEAQLAQLQSQVNLASQHEAAAQLSASDRALLMQALSQLSAILSIVDQQLDSGQIPADRQTQVRSTLAQMRVTLSNMGTTLAAMNAGSNVAVTPTPAPSQPVATAPGRPQVTAQVPDNSGVSTPEVTDEEIAQAPQAPQAPAPQTANLGDTARRWGENWNFWLILLLVAIAAVAGVLLRRRGPSTPVANADQTTITKTQEPPQNPTNTQS